MTIATKNCLQCGMEFAKSRRGKAQWNGRKFCSNKCGADARRGTSRTNIWSVSHGLSHTAIYAVWESMKQRCLNPSSHAWRHYGGRGITVSERWLSFDNFYADMGPRPSNGTLERIDNNGPYAPGNCTWKTMAEQSVNKRCNRNITINGRTLTARDWERSMGYKKGLIISRICTYGWNDYEAVMTPPRLGNKQTNRVQP